MDGVWKSRKDYAAAFAVAREEIGTWSVPASKLIASQIAEHPVGKRFFYSFAFVNGFALRLLQKSPPFVTQDSAHLKGKALQGGIVTSSHFFDGAKQRHLIGEQYCIDSENQNVLDQFNLFLRDSCLPRELFNDPDVVFGVDQGKALIASFAATSSLSSARAATKLFFDWFHQQFQFKKKIQHLFFS